MSSRQLLANAIRVLSMDAVQKANSGHPGAPMGMADIAEVLWNDFLRHNPNNPLWLNRDRFVLSNGHASMLLYSLLHLSGYAVSLTDLMHFRQMHSNTPGHPEYGLTPGVETTTGPLGQGISNAVGMAIAERTLAAQFNRNGYPIIDHYTYVFLGDGCLMEGISHESCSLAGTLGLGKLIAFWDNNHISIDGHVDNWFTDDTPKRFMAYNWHVISDVDGHNPEAIIQAILTAQAITDKPSLISCRTIIGQGSPHLANSHEAHGSPLGTQEVKLTREKLAWPYEPFVIPIEVYQGWDAREAGESYETKWQQLFAAYQKQYPKLAADLLRRIQGELPLDWQTQCADFLDKIQADSKELATRKASQQILNQWGPTLPELLGGSADLTASNCTDWSGSVAITAKQATGNYLHYGVREFAMSAIMNGIALHGGFIPYGGTFLTFSDYARNAVRLSALMKIRVIYVYTHDSIGLGEDGPTHQPIEHAAMLRLTPNLSVWRPCDKVETAVAWQVALENKHSPTCLLLTRQSLPHQVRDSHTLANVKKGGYILLDCEENPEAIIIATGSEVSLAIAAAQELITQGKKIRVVSMPSTDTYEQQPASYRDSVLPIEITARVAVEAAAKDYWYKYVGLNGKIIGIDRFGESAPYQEIYKLLGITKENIINTVLNLINSNDINKQLT